MQYDISNEQLAEWCSIPHGELAARKDLNVSELRIFDTKANTMSHIGDLMADEVKKRNAAGLPTRWILPAGPLEQYDTFIARVNKERISLKNVWAFHMDEWLDWQGRPFPVRYALNSLKGIMLERFYGHIDPELTIPEAQRIWPDIHDPDAYDAKVEEVGGIDTVWAGIGCKGLIAFDESPRDPFRRITIEQYAQSKTRIVQLNGDTIVALSQRETGGCYDIIPPMAITVGFKSILTASRIVFMITTGSWKNTVIRVILFAKPTLEYPVTLLTDRIPEKILCCDEATVTHPMESDPGYYTPSIL